MLVSLMVLVMLIYWCDGSSSQVCLSVGWRLFHPGTPAPRNAVSFLPQVDTITRQRDALQQGALREHCGKLQA